MFTRVVVKNDSVTGGSEVVTTLVEVEMALLHAH